MTKQRTYLLHSNNVTLRRPSVSAHCCIWICSSSSSNPCKVWNGKNGLNLTKVKISLNFWIINITVWSIITKPTCGKTNHTPNTAGTQQTNAYRDPPSLAANGAFSVAPTPHGFLARAQWQGRRLRTKRKKIQRSPVVPETWVGQERDSFWIGWEECSYSTRSKFRKHYSVETI